MFRRRSAFAISMLVAAALLTAPARAGRYDDQPDTVVVQHILIAFKRSVPGKKIERTKKDARELAESLLERAQAGEEFGALVAEYTDDQAPGIIRITNEDRPVMANAMGRRDLAVYFGDVAFTLEVGEIGMAKYHGGNSPYGWHIIKRLE